MGKLVEGKWTTQWYEPDEDGHFVRPDTQFRGTVTTESGAKFAPEADRYHLYISLACPWAHRVNLVRCAMGLQDALPMSIVDPHMGDDGWVFDDTPGSTPDLLLGKRMLRDVYTEADSKYTGRVTVPVLWDTKHSTIVNNESRELIRMLSTAFGDLATTEVRFFDADRAEAIDDAIDAIYEPINNGVYRAGFAASQKAYDEAVSGLFDALDHWESVLGQQPFMVGDSPTEADVCLFTTLIRFDAVYHGHFKCNRRRIIDYPNLSRVMRAVYEIPGVAETVNLKHITTHYYWSHTGINPTRIVPTGPAALWRE